jgi:hypothetical protein
MFTGLGPLWEVRDCVRVRVDVYLKTSITLIYHKPYSTTNPKLPLTLTLTLTLTADRFLALVKDGFFTDIAFFRCVKRFLTQFGISDNPKMKVRVGVRLVIHLSNRSFKTLTLTSNPSLLP